MAVDLPPRPSVGGRVRPDFLRRGAHLAFLVITCLLATSWLEHALPNYWPKDWSRAHEFDGLEDWVAVRAYVQGKNPYAHEYLEEVHHAGMGHPPTTGFWFLPVARLEKAIAAETAAIGNLVLFALCIYLCAVELGFPAPAATAVLVFAWCCTTDGVVMHWVSIQLSMQIAFAQVLSWIYLRRGKEVSGGIALGLAATVKLFPGVLILFLLVARRFRAFLAASLAFLAVAAPMTMRYGLRSWLQWFEYQSHITEWVGSIRNASLHGIVLRLIKPVCLGGVLPNRTASLISNLAGVALLTAAGWLSWRTLRHARREDPRSIDMPFALFAVLSAFVNPWVWEHYYVLLVQPAFVLGAHLVRRFAATWRLWIDEATSHGKLASDAAASLVGLGCMAGVAYVLSMSQYAKMEIESIWQNHPSPWAHRQLHLTEVLNFAPWVVMALLCLWGVWFLSPVRGRAGAPAPKPSAVTPPPKEAAT